MDNIVSRCVLTPVNDSHPHGAFTSEYCPRHSCGWTDLSSTPLPPVLWPLQLWGDREAVIGGGGVGSGGGTNAVASPHAYGELIPRSSEDGRWREASAPWRRCYITHAEPSPSLTSYPALSQRR